MDRIIRTITSDGTLMASAIDTTQLVYTAQQLHGLTKTSCAALGRLLTGTSLMGAMLKETQATLTVKVAGDGPLGNLLAIADSRGNVRGYVDNPGVELPVRPDGKLNVGGAVGHNGRLAVIRDFGTGEPYAGQVELVSGEIAEDITNYYAVSQQTPTVCALGVLVDREEGCALLAGGLLIQALPGADEMVLAHLEKNIAQLDSVTTMLAKGLDLEEICYLALQGFEVEKLDEFPVHYVCNCSKERFTRVLLTLPSEDIATLPLNDCGCAETVCQYCNRKYYFSQDELLVLAKKAQKN
ncbi:Hsp33 family molecular chaperone HslO [Acutalibacter caecimuris]|uniref:Hsp33 family molecular chaperone HslO n=1 Tax=Acutalibacter caecimuris TaxID=3093657 RepID=UPI002AC92A61|nr:Hsp33 family molecular chaperone HslO [Acutalibacter sp. M00118]